MYHRRDGNSQVLEEELLNSRALHDDTKDALASAVDIAVAPSIGWGLEKAKSKTTPSSRFGGS